LAHQLHDGDRSQNTAGHHVPATLSLRRLLAIGNILLPARRRFTTKALSHLFGGRTVALNIHCIVVQVPDMTDYSRTRVQPAMQDLVPWADPYIAGLVEKLARSGGRLLESSESDGRRRAGERSEMAPPFPDYVDPPQSPRSGDWFRRNGWVN